MQIADAGGKKDMIQAGKALLSLDGRHQDKDSAVLKENTEKRNGVTVDFSKQALEMLQQQMQANKDSADAAGKAAEDQAKIMEIARRIARGDKVPPKDEKKLMEYSSKLYQMAKMSAMMSKARKHKKHKSLFDEEEDNDMREKLRALESDSSIGEVEGSDAGSAEAETGSEGLESD